MTPNEKQVQRLGFAAAEPQIAALTAKVHAALGDSHVQVVFVALVRILADGLSPWDTEHREAMLNAFSASVREILATRPPE